MRWLNLSLGTGVPKYLALAHSIRAAVLDGRLVSGEKLPSTRLLAEQLAMNRHTVMTACDELVAEGYLVSLPRVGYQVAPNLPITSSYALDACNSDESALPLVTTQHYAAVTSLDVSSAEYNFAGGLPDLSLFPRTQFKRWLVKAFDGLSHSELHYGEHFGSHALRQQISSYLAHARDLKHTPVMITNGSQEALFIVAKTLLQQGDKVAMESYSYPPARAAFIAAGGEIVTIAQDDEGIIPESLALALAAGKVKLIYLTPLHQYPTTVTLSIRRRLAIRALAKQYGAVIVEDDYDHEFHYRCQPLRPMAADDNGNGVVYISTFSKLMYAGARIGYIAASQALLNEFVKIKKLLNHKNETLSQKAVAMWMESGDFVRHLRKTSKCYQQRRDHLVALLQAYQANGWHIEFSIPDGGMAIWLDCKRDITGLKEQAWQQGIYLQVESEFAPELKQCRHIRLGYAYMNEATMSKAIKKLFLILERFS